MNKRKIMGIALLAALALILVSTGAAIASGLNQGGPSVEGQFSEDSNNWGPMHGRGGRWSSEESYPPMHETMVQAVADQTGLSVEAINARIEDGERLIEIALDAGMAEEAFFDLLQEVREAFWKEAFEAGLISEERYQWLLERKAGDQYRPGLGGCHRFNEGEFPIGRGQQRGGGRRW